jgi:hypothetical protein
MLSIKKNIMPGTGISWNKYDISLPLPQFYEAVLTMRGVLGTYRYASILSA